MQDFLLLYLLLPVAAASGWLGAHKHYAARAKAGEMERLRQAYRGSLGFLLRDNPEQAAALVSGSLDAIGGESYSAHMALAALARKEGLVERAIALHQALLKERGLGSEERGQIHFELGMDYLRAGLFDRAEEIFTGLLALPAQREAALAQLLDIYQQEKDWAKALDCLQHIDGERGRRGETAAQFHCEMAQMASNQGRPDEALSHLASALQQEPQCVRASLLSADVAIAAQDFSLAYRHLKRVEKQNPAYLTEIFPYFLSHGERLAERRELREYLDWLGAKYQSAEAAVALAGLLARNEGADKAADYLAAAVAAHPSLRGLHALLGLMCELPSPAAHLFVVRQSLQRFVLNRPHYHCSHCGFDAETLFWRCPACLYWETLRGRQDSI